MVFGMALLNRPKISKGAFEKATLSLYLWEWTKRNAQNAAKLRVFAAPGSAIFVKDFALQGLQNVEFFPALRAGLCTSKRRSPGSLPGGKTT